MAYAVGMARQRTRTDGIALRVTPFVKRLLLGVIRGGGFGSEAAAVESALREYAERRKIQPVSEEEYEAYKEANRSPRKDVRDALAKKEE